ncbi:MAG: YIP1 family protein [Nitrospirota bacterium]
MATYKERLIAASKLNSALYEEVEADTTAMNQAMLTVILSSVAAGIGTIGRGGVAGIVLGAVAALAGWFVWALLTYLIGTKLLPQPQTQATLGEMLRTIGFSSAPGLIRVAGIIPGLTGIVFFAASVWMLVAMVIGVRQALDYTSTLRAVVVCLIGWLLQVIIIGLLFYSFGGLPRTF